MEQNKYKLKDFAEAVSTAIQDPQSTFYDKFVGLEHYDSGEPVVKRYQSTELLTSACKEFHKNDILIARRNVYLKRAGIAFFDGLTSGDSIVLRVYTNCEDRTGIPYEVAIRMLPFVLNSNAFWTYANRHADGMNSKRISKDKVLDYEFDLPSLSEQKRLAEKLWAAYEVKQSYLKMIEATDEMVKSQFIEMFDFNDLSLTEPSDDFDKFCKDNTSSATKIPAGNYLNEGLYPIYDQSQDTLIAGYTNSKDGVCEEIPVVLFGDHSRVIKYIDQPFFIGADGVKIIKPKSDVIIPEFLFYDMKYHNIPNTGYNRHFKFVKMIKLTIPSKGKQNEFLSIADQADKSKFICFKSQFIEMFGSHPTTSVGNFIEDSYPGEWGTEDKEGNGVKVIRTTNFTNSGNLDLTDVVTRSIVEKKVEKKAIHKYDTILERSGGTADNPVGRVVLFEEDDLYLCNNFTQVLRFKNIDPRFAFYSLYFFYQTNKTAVRAMGSKTTGIQNLNMSKYLETGVPNASEQEQKTFVSIAEQADKSKYNKLIA